MRSSAEIQAIFQHGKRVDAPAVSVLWRETDDARRAGFAVSRQIQGAVRRNRARRRLREAYRLVRSAAPPRIALVVIAKRRALDVPFTALAAEMRAALSRIDAPRMTE